jgi:NADH-quinone oxidoreductase subunit G
MIDPKLVNPKKDIGPHTLLYQDRCVMCSRCVRFTQEISGTHELCVINRGARAEIDVFPGKPLDNPLQGNVVDICPVGSLLDKDFLFRRRVWELSETPSVCPGCATGCTIRIDHADQAVYRLKPRFNPRINDWWICDEGRFGWKYVHDPKRISAPRVRRGLEIASPQWEEVPEIIRFRLQQHVKEYGDATVAAVLSPFMATEEAWLLVHFLRELAPRCTLVLGPIPNEGPDCKFPIESDGRPPRFTIHGEKCPNRRGVELVITSAGGVTAGFEEFIDKVAGGELRAAWIVGGYPKPWVDAKAAKVADKFALWIVQDLFENAFTEAATVVLPACAWAEREGSFVNSAGVSQPFARAIDPPDGAKRDGQYLYEIAGFAGLYTGQRVREMLAAELPAVAGVYVPPAPPRYAH